MTIRIIKKPDIYLTATQLRAYREQFRREFMMYSGPLPDFDEWVYSQEQSKKKDVSEYMQKQGM